MVATVRRTASGERKCRKLSTKAERDAWKQAERKADKRAPKEPLPGETGRREKKAQKAE